MKALHEENARFVHIGSLDRLSIRAQEVLGCAKNLTRNNGPFIFNLAFNYGGRDEILHALRKLLSQKVPTGKITEAMINRHLYTSGLPKIVIWIRATHFYGNNPSTGSLREPSFEGLRISRQDL